MSTANNYYSTLDLEYPFPNDFLIETNDTAELEKAQVFAQFNTVVGNMVFTPDHEVDPEDLQFRISKEAKFFLGSNDANSNNSNYTLSIQDVENADELQFKSYHNAIQFSAEKLNMKGITVSDYGSSTRISTQKMFQIRLWLFAFLKQHHLGRHVLVNHFCCPHRSLLVPQKLPK